MVGTDTWRKLRRKRVLCFLDFGLTFVFVLITSIEYSGQKKNMCSVNQKGLFSESNESGFTSIDRLATVICQNLNWPGRL